MTQPRGSHKRLEESGKGFLVGLGVVHREWFTMNGKSLNRGDSKMYKSQKILLIVYLAGVLFFSVFFVPYKAKCIDRNIEYYSSLWAPRNHKLVRTLEDANIDSYYPTCSVKINTAVWFVEMVTLSILCGGAYILLGHRRSKKLDPELYVPEVS